MSYKILLKPVIILTFSGLLFADTEKRNRYPVKGENVGPYIALQLFKMSSIVFGATSLITSRYYRYIVMDEHREDLFLKGALGAYVAYFVAYIAEKTILSESNSRPKIRSSHLVANQIAQHVGLVAEVGEIL